MNYPLTTKTIQDRLERVMERVYCAAQRSGRNPTAVRLVLVTKTHPVEVVLAAVDAGARRFGENYAEEALPKIQACQNVPGVEWHMIGHIQSRKAALVCQHFAYVHSLDGARLALRLNRFAVEQGKVLPVLLECNASGEQTKFGWGIHDEAGWVDLLPDIHQVVSQSNLRVLGLMTMAPYTEDAQFTRPFFNRLRRFAIYLQEKIPQASWTELSMGMSGDYEAAVEEGATWVRIGQAILGARSIH